MRSLFVLLFIFCVQPSFALEKVNTTLYNYAKACPTSSTKNTKTLVSYLSKGGNSQSQRVELFCYWITENIAYDTQGYVTGKPSPTSTVLTTKKGVCQNYAELLQDMCEMLGIECHVIPGYSKGYGYSKTKAFQFPDHAWNIVKVDGKYVYIDATWASGNVQSVKGKLTFTKNLHVEELFAEPDYFLSKHLPADPRWQMRSTPITLKSFHSNDSINRMLKTTIPNYNFQDSITVFLKADSLDRRVISAASAYLFNPVKDNLSYLGDSYYNKAWHFSNHVNTISNQETAIVWYNKSISIYSKLGNSYGAKWIGNAKKGIEYANAQIEILKGTQ